MNFKDKINSLSKTEDVEIKTLGMTLKVKKVTLNEAKEFEAFSKKVNNDPVQLVHYLGCLVFSDEEGPIFDAKNLDVAKALPISVNTELINAFIEVNKIDISEQEKN